MSGDDHLTIGEIQYQDLGFERFAHDLSPVIKAQIFDYTHSHKSGLLRMELDAGDGAVL